MPGKERSVIESRLYSRTLVLAMRKAHESPREKAAEESPSAPKARRAGPPNVSPAR